MARRRFSRMWLPAAVLAIGGVVARGRSMPAEASFGISPSPSDSARNAFWVALRDLDLALADKRAPDAEHRRFLDALRLVLAGRMPDAESRLAPLAREAADSVLRQGARFTLTSVLEFQGKWKALYEISREPVSRRDDATGRAGIELWSNAMRIAPAPRLGIPRDGVSLPFRPTATGTPIIEVRVNGRTKHFWVDTGSSITLVSSDVAAECGVLPLLPDTLEMVTSVGRVGARAAVIERLELGWLAIFDQSAAIIDSKQLTLTETLERGGTELIRIDGVIGFDVLRRLAVRIDYGTGYVSFARPPRDTSSATRVRNLFWLGYPVVRLTTSGGTPMHFGLDTGADSTFATENLVRKIPRRRVTRQRIRIAGFGADTTVLAPVVSGLRFLVGGKPYWFRALMIRSPRRLIFVDLDGIIGSDVGAGRAIRIDMTNGIFALEAS